MRDINFEWYIISQRAHMLLACAIHHPKDLTEEILVLKYPHCFFCFFWINIPQSFCLRYQCNYTLTLLVPRAPLFCWNLYNHGSSADWVKELFKPSKDVGSLVVYIFYKLEKFGFWFSCGWRHNGGRFMHFIWGHQVLGVKPMTQFFDSKFYLKLGYKSSY